MTFAAFMPASIARRTSRSPNKIPVATVRPLGRSMKILATNMRLRRVVWCRGDDVVDGDWRRVFRRSRCVSRLYMATRLVERVCYVRICLPVVRVARGGVRGGIMVDFDDCLVHLGSFLACMPRALASRPKKTPISSPEYAKRNGA